MSDVSDFLAEGPFAVVGASNNREKYGNKVLRAYMQHGMTVYPVNPKETEVEGLPCYATLADCPAPPRGVSIITPPRVTEQVVEAAAAVGARYVWMQPGAESEQAIARAAELGLTTIANGPCVLVSLRFHD
jgi:predicted CoA-binding protein